MQLDQVNYPFNVIPNIYLTNEESCLPETGFHTSLGSWRTHYTNSISNCYTNNKETILLTFLVRNVNNPKPMPHIMHIKLYKIYNIIADWMPRNISHLQSTMKVLGSGYK